MRKAACPTRDVRVSCIHRSVFDAIRFESSQSSLPPSLSSVPNRSEIKSGLCVGLVVPRHRPGSYRHEPSLPLPSRYRCAIDTFGGCRAWTSPGLVIQRNTSFRTRHVRIACASFDVPRTGRHARRESLDRATGSLSGDLGAGNHGHGPGQWMEETVGRDTRRRIQRVGRCTSAKGLDWARAMSSSARDGCIRATRFVEFCAYVD